MTWQKEVDEIKKRSRLAERMGGEEGVARQHKRGKLTIRERIAALVDPDSFKQGSYHWQADDDKNFSSINYESGVVSSTKCACKSIQPMLDGIWYWRVKTQDLEGAWGPYSDYSVIKIDSTINKPITVDIEPQNWTSRNYFEIDWRNYG